MSASSSPLWYSKFRLFLILLAALLFFDSASASLVQELQADIPERVAIGEAFCVRVTSPLEFEEIHITWLGQAFTLPMKQKEGQSSCIFYLGTDVKKQKPGKKQLMLRASNADGQGSALQSQILVQEIDYPVQRLQVKESKVSLSSEALARHRREKKAVNNALSTVSEKKIWLEGFQRPAKGEVSSAYGLKRFFNGKPRSPHRGLDLRTGMAAPIRACNTGRVILCDDHFFAGKSIYVDHGLGLVSMYFHLSEILVQEGQLVKKGQLIGKSGKSGRVTGPHLHFGISAFGQLINPLPMISAN